MAAAVNIATKVTIMLMTIRPVAVPAESSCGLHTGSGFEDKADHCRNRQYRITRAEVSSEASLRNRKHTMNYINTLSTVVTISKAKLREQPSIAPKFRNIMTIQVTLAAVARKKMNIQKRAEHEQGLFPSSSMFLARRSLTKKEQIRT